MATSQATMWGSIAGLGLLITALVILGVVVYEKESKPAEVKIDCGTLKGIYNSTHKVYTFKGVPYAVPPVGERRWRPPEEMSLEMGTCWTGTRNATMYPPKCSQIDFNAFMYEGSEDCLYLDIYTPDLKGNRPVLVYIHGGGLLGGSGHDAAYHPGEKLTKKMDVIFVSIQYRLGALGFLVSSDLKDRTGNYGLLDSLEALKWVQKHISKFGGDPDNVAVFGHSSGGTLVQALLVMEQAQGLFHRAWVSSGSAVLQATYADAEIANTFLTEKVGCSNATDAEQCLMQTDASTLTWGVLPQWNKDYSEKIPVKDQFDIPYIVIDGTYLKAGFLESYQMNSPSLVDVPIMIGSTAEEMDFSPGVPDGTPMLEEWTVDTYNTVVNTSLSTFNQTYPAWVLDHYPATPDTVRLAYVTLVSDCRILCPSNKLAAAAATALSSPVYRYIVDYRPSSPAWGLLEYAFHSWDIYAFFGEIDKVIMYSTPTPDDYAFSEVMQEHMGLFLTTGTVSWLWDVYPMETTYMGSTARGMYGLDTTKCDFWLNNGFYPYGILL